MNKDILEMIEYPKEGILSKDIIKNPNLNITLFCMAKNSELLKHTSALEGAIYVIEGGGIFNLEGKDIEMKPGVFIHMNANAVHSLKAEENTSFLLTLIKEK